MPQTLYKFGVDSANLAAKVNTPTAIITNAEINILWASWCDLIYTTLTHDLEHTVNYLGSGLNAAQQLDLQSGDLISSFSDMRQSTLTAGTSLHFFGTTMHDGVRGYVVGRKVTMYGTPGKDRETGDAYRDVVSWEIPHATLHPLAKVSMCSDDSLLAACRPFPDLEPGYEAFEPRSVIASPDHGIDVSYEKPKAKRSRASTVDLVKSLQNLQEYCSTEASAASVANFAPTLLVVNATTATALDENGRVHTRTTDPRYAACLGRPHTSTSTFEPVPYLSETRIVKIASGGYMTAAISDDGELFLWGRANPGTEGELGVLHRLDYQVYTKELKRTVIWVDSEQDDDVKCLKIRMDGRDAIACDIAVGFGHILVAAKDGLGQHVVFAAGCGEEGQLGLGENPSFLKEFEEVVAFRGKQVIKMAAAGWSSFVVVD